MVGISCTDVDGPHNHTHGDLLAPSGCTIEVKRQPIDPKKYPANFVEIMEDMTRNPKPHHVGGFVRTAEILRIQPEDLARLRVTTPQAKSTHALGTLSHVSASLESMTRAKFVIYANPELAVVYIYSAMGLLREVRKNARRKLIRGAGASNEDTIATFVPNSHASFRRVGDVWEPYAGTHSTKTVSEFLTKYLT